MISGLDEAVCRTHATGVSVTFFCSAIRTLEKHHGRKMMGHSNDDDTLESFRKALAVAESLYVSLPPVPKKTKRSR